MSHKTYNTPHRSRVVKARLTEEEYSDFEERCTTLQINQTEYIQWYRNLEGKYEEH